MVTRRSFPNSVVSLISRLVRGGGLAHTLLFVVSSSSTSAAFNSRSNHQSRPRTKWWNQVPWSSRCFARDSSAWLVWNRQIREREFVSPEDMSILFIARLAFKSLGSRLRSSTRVIFKKHRYSRGFYWFQPRSAWNHAPFTTSSRRETFSLACRIFTFVAGRRYFCPTFPISWFRI